MLWGNRNGFFYVLDRTNGKSLLTAPFGPVNWTLGIDKEGRPIPNPDKEPARDGRLIAPNEGGATNYRSPSFDPKTGLFIVSAHPSWSIYFAKPADGTYGWAGADYNLFGQNIGIGTTNPGVMLHIAKSHSTFANYLRLFNSFMSLL